jgi:hypothetical protein
MTSFQKRYVKIYLDLSLMSIECQIPQEGIYFMTISRRTEKWKSHQFSLSSNEITNIEEAFHFPCHFLALTDETWRSKFLKLKLIQKQKSTKKVIAIWKYDLKILQHQHHLSLQLSPDFNCQYLGNISLSLIISNLNSNKLSNNTYILSKTNIQDQMNLSEFNSSYSNSSQYTSSFDYSNLNQQKNSSSNSFLNSCDNDFSLCNDSNQTITSICDELISDDLEQIKTFPMISKKIISEIVANISSFESIFFVLKRSNTLSSHEQKDTSRKLYGLIATLHLISTLQQKPLLAKEDLNVIIDSLTKLYQNVLNSILEDAKSHFENENQIISFCFNLLDQLNQIGNGEYCNIIYSSLLIGFVLSIPEEFSDLFCENLCVSKIEKKNMRERNIDSISILFQKYSFL